MSEEEHRLSGGGRTKARRSLLSAPASSLDMIEKALATEADAVMIDLEDAVAPNEKAEARQNIVQSLKELDRGGKIVLYRVNALDTAFFYRDQIEVVEEAGDALDAVVIPKVNRPEDLQAWFEWEEEALRYGVNPDASREELAAFIEGSTVMLVGEEHRTGHSAAGDFVRWGRQGGLTTLNLYGRGWFALLAQRRWEKISAVQLAEAFSTLTIRARP